MKKISGIAASLLLVTTLGALGLTVWEYMRDRDRSRSIYTRVVKLKDIIDTTSKALAILVDAELRAQDYALTGETAYSEAYAQDIRDWQDEIGSLELIGGHDPAAALIRDFSEEGKRTIGELNLVVSTCDHENRESALARIRKGTAIVYLDQVRKTADEIRDIHGRRVDATIQLLVTTPVKLIRRFAVGAVLLCCITILASLTILAIGIRTRVPGA
ncbi:MAG: CHASE3 domain-containing protein [Acidobacteriota bacterium]|nr:CHASE3 domain-containing protein [Acidobacteriota bacterium]